MRIALAGAPDTGLSQLFEALRRALQASGWPVRILMAEPGAAHGHDLTFLMGLQSAPDDMLAADQSIRAALIRTGTAYEVLYGSADERVAQALRAIEHRLVATEILAPLKPSRSSQTWQWICDKCSDPVCEHRLLTDLLAQRLTAP